MINLYNGDCLEVMDKLIADGIVVNAIITDPPYRITSRGSSGSMGGYWINEKTKNGKIFDNNN